METIEIREAEVKHPRKQKNGKLRGINGIPTQL